MHIALCLSWEVLWNNWYRLGNKVLFLPATEPLSKMPFKKIPFIEGNVFFLFHFPKHSTLLPIPYHLLNKCDLSLQGIPQIRFPFSWIHTSYLVISSYWFVYLHRMINMWQFFSWDPRMWPWAITRFVSLSFLIIKWKV